MTTKDVEEIELPAQEALQVRLALMTLDRDKALFGAAEARMREAQASMIGIKAQLVQTQARAEEVQTKFLALLTEDGKYELLCDQNQVDLEAKTVKRRLRK